MMLPKSGLGRLLVTATHKHRYFVMGLVANTKTIANLKLPRNHLLPRLDNFTIWTHIMLLLLLLLLELQLDIITTTILLVEQLVAGDDLLRLLAYRVIPAESFRW